MASPLWLLWVVSIIGGIIGAPVYQFTSSEDAV